MTRVSSARHRVLALLACRTPFRFATPRPVLTRKAIPRSLVCTTGVRPNVLSEIGGCRHLNAGVITRLCRSVRYAYWEAITCECNLADLGGDLPGSKCPWHIYNG